MFKIWWWSDEHMFKTRGCSFWWPCSFGLQLWPCLIQGQLTDGLRHPVELLFNLGHLGLDLQIKKSMPGKRLEHVIEKGNSGLDLVLA